MNRLARETSPYLRQHAENPVDWYPWGDEALARSRAENKPILLSVGYSACHWCHVMAHESFENPAIAQQMNDAFINVKVDREERPDLDQLYQGVVQLMGRGGGWPLTVFLLPDLRPFFGGTYFPPQDRHGMPGFPSVLTQLSQAFQGRREDVEAQAHLFHDGLVSLSRDGLDAPAAEPQKTDIVSTARYLEKRLDRTHGGFGGAPKFPNPMNLALMLRGWRRSGDEALRSGVMLTLEKMAHGGIYDQLGGGFHRYATDERWLVPHFEKMLYDNAQLVHLYAEAQQVEPRALWARVVAQTVAYVRREMTSPEGPFYTAQDADSEGEEGKFFVWRIADIDAELPAAQARLVRAHYGVREGGNFEHGASVLEVVRPVEALAGELGQSPEQVHTELAAAKAQLFAARQKRVPPGRDDKVLAGWNGLMIRGLAFASRVFEQPEWVTLARRAADGVLAQLWKDGKLARTPQGAGAGVEGFIEDYGDLAAGLVALYQASFEPRYLEAAEAMVDRAVERFWDPARQAYLSAAHGQKDLVAAPYALHDNAFPSGASTLTEAQVALAALTGRGRHLEQALTYLRKLRDEALRSPFGYGHLLLAADAALDGAAAVTIVGGAAEPLVRAVNAVYAPTVALCRHDPAQPTPVVLAEVLQGRAAIAGQPAAYVCRHFSCDAPVTDAASLRQRLEGESRS